MSGLRPLVSSEGSFSRMRPESLAPLSNSHRPTLAALDPVTNHSGQDLRERISSSQPLTNSLSSQTRLVSTLGKTSCQGDGVAYRVVFCSKYLDEEWSSESSQRLSTPSSDPQSTR